MVKDKEIVPRIIYTTASRTILMVGQGNTKFKRLVQEHLNYVAPNSLVQTNDQPGTARISRTEREASTALVRVNEQVHIQIRQRKGP
jgi:hypothetical protein